MNEVSIIINGVRYDAVEAPKDIDFTCDTCDLHKHCSEISEATQGASIDVCALELGDKVFKKSDKKFER